MDGFSLQESATRRGFPTWPNYVPLKRCHPFSAHVPIGDHLEELAIILADVTMLRAYEPDGVCNHRVQYGLEFSGWGCNNPQHLSRCGLLVQCLGEVAVPDLQLVV